MPLDTRHAFNDGMVYGKTKASRFQRCLIRWLDQYGLELPLPLKVARMWMQFNRYATISDETLLGPQAWCFNPKGNASDILMEGRVIFRGFIRLERFGRGFLRIEPDVYVGDDTLISCADSIHIGRYTLIAHNVHIFDNNSHPMDWRDRQTHWASIGDRCPDETLPIKHAPVRIGQHVWIGFNSIIHKGVTIGDRSIVAAGSVVMEDIPPDSLAAGNPARIIRKLNETKDSMPIAGLETTDS